MFDVSWDNLMASWMTGLGPDWLFAAVAVLAGYMVLGIAGFGSALIIIPILAWKWPLTLIVPLVLLIDIPASLLHTGLNLKKVIWHEIPGLLPTAVLGSVSGVLLLRWSNGAWLLVLLGVYIVWVGWRGFSGARTYQQIHVRHRWLAGYLIGTVESMFGTAGPLVMTWLSRRIPDIQNVRATLPCAILIFASIALLGAVMNGSLSAHEVWWHLISLLPVAIAGVFVGHRVARYASSRVLSLGVYGLLELSGLTLIVKALLPISRSLFS